MRTFKPVVRSNHRNPETLWRPGHEHTKLQQTLPTKINWFVGSKFLVETGAVNVLSTPESLETSGQSSMPSSLMQKLYTSKKVCRPSGVGVGDGPSLPWFLASSFSPKERCRHERRKARRFYKFRDVCHSLVKEKFCFFLMSRNPFPLPGFVGFIFFWSYNRLGMAEQKVLGTTELLGWRLWWLLH